MSPIELSHKPVLIMESLSHLHLPFAFAVHNMILASIFVCFCLASAFNYFRQRRQRGFVVNLKGPFAWPLMGAMHKIVLLTPNST